ncbi:hypothetical protein GCM10023107_56420 [Actinoplanes octamycinicus]
MPQSPTMAGVQEAEKLPVTVRVVPAPLNRLRDTVRQQSCDRKDHLDGGHDESAGDSRYEAESPV